jgi:hypothetical protein
LKAFGQPDRQTQYKFRKAVPYGAAFFGSAVKQKNGDPKTAVLFVP